MTPFLIGLTALCLLLATGVIVCSCLDTCRDTGHTSPMTQTRIVCPIAADQLRPGDIVINGITREREHGVFDVDLRGDDAVRVWIPMADIVNRNMPEMVTYEPNTSLLVETYAE